MSRTLVIMVKNASPSTGIIIIGGGFGGLTTALALSRIQPRPAITLIDTKSQFIFQPLLYELLSNEVQSWEIAPTYRTLLSKRGISVIKDKVTTINTSSQIVTTSSELSIKYNQIVVCTGSIPKITGSKISGNFLTFANLDDVEKLKRKIKKINSTEESKNLIVVGAGWSGIELASKIADLINKQNQVHLIEIGDKILPKAKSFNREQAENALNKKNIETHFLTEILSAKAHQIELQTNINSKKTLSFLKHDGLILATGFQPMLPSICPKIELQNSCLPINEFCQVKNHTNFFALGDVAFDSKNPLPNNAQVAIQQAEIVAKNLMANENGTDFEKFKFKDLGEMLSLGIGEASITAMGLTLAGPLAYKLRRLTYLRRMPDFFLRIKSTSSWLLSH